jgi:hypothetical protein
MVQNELEFGRIMKKHQKNSVEKNLASFFGQKARQRIQKNYCNYKDPKMSISVLKKIHYNKKPPPPRPLPLSSSFNGRLGSPKPPTKPQNSTTKPQNPDPQTQPHNTNPYFPPKN